MSITYSLINSLYIPNDRWIYQESSIHLIYSDVVSSGLILTAYHNSFFCYLHERIHSRFMYFLEHEFYMCIADLCTIAEY